MLINIVFQTKDQSHKIHKMLRYDYGRNVGVITGDLDISTIFMLWQKFCDGDIRILVATDILSRCIGSENVCLVVNFDIPNLMLYFKVYQYRAGRTAQFGGSGSVITLLSSKIRSVFTATFQREYGITLNEF